MLTGMGVADLKLVKGGRKLKKAKYCTSLNLERDDRIIASELEKLKWKQEVEKEKATVGNMKKDASNRDIAQRSKNSRLRHHSSDVATSSATSTTTLHLHAEFRVVTSDCNVATSAMLQHQNRTTTSQQR